MQENKELAKAIIIALSFTLLIAFLGMGVQGGGEYKFNLLKAKEGCENEDNQQACEDYTPLFHYLANLFSFSDNSFWFFVVFLFAFVIPMIFYYLTKNAMSVWLYISSTSSFYFFIDGVFPQGLALGICLLIFAVKDWRIQALLVLAGALTHGHGFYLALTAFLLNRTWIYIEANEFDFNKILLSCSGIFGNFRPEILDTKIEEIGGLVIAKAYPISIANILSLFSKMFPLPFWIISFWYSIKKRWRWDLLIMALFAIAFAFIPGGSHRSWYLVPYMLIPATSMFYKDLEGSDAKFLFIAFTVFMFIIQIWSWWNYKILCQ